MEHPMAILESARGFMKSRIILTGAELDLFTRIHQGTDTVDALAEETGADNRALTRLLDALVAYDVLKKKNDRYALSPAAQFLSANHPESILPMMIHMNELWDAWSHLTDTVKEGENVKRTSVSRKDEDSMAAFIGAMHVVGRGLSKEIAAELDLSPYRKLLDIGGASGTYTIAFLEKNPDMRAVIFDLPQVIPMAKRRIAKSAVADRVAFEKGDFYADPLPRGCDLALLSAIIHQNSAAENLDLYQKIHDALEPGGTLLIRDHIMEPDRTCPPGGTVFAINMLSVTAGGDTYTFHEIREGLETAGFQNIRLLRQGERMDGIVSAEKANR